MSEPREAGDPGLVAVRIRAFVLERFPLARRRALSDEDSLLQSGIVDSLGILELVDFVIGEFNVDVTDEDLLPENFDSIRSLATFVERRGGSGS
jgi:acyl carrier protein